MPGLFSSPERSAIEIRHLVRNRDSFDGRSFSSTIAPGRGCLSSRVAPHRRASSGPRSGTSGDVLAFAVLNAIGRATPQDCHFHPQNGLLCVSVSESMRLVQISPKERTASKLLYYSGVPEKFRLRYEWSGTRQSRTHAGVRRTVRAVGYRTGRQDTSDCDQQG